MTTQDAGTQAFAGEGAESPIAPDEAERLASMIRPAWEIELDEGELQAPPPAAPAPAAAAPAASALAAAAVPVHAAETAADLAALDAAAEKLAEGGVDQRISSSAQIAPPRDTVIDGVPTVGVGDTDPGGAVTRTEGGVAAAIAAGVAIVDRGVAAAQIPRPEPPRRAGPTKVGLGEDVQAAISALPAPPLATAAVRDAVVPVDAVPVDAVPAAAVPVTGAGATAVLASAPTATAATPTMAKDPLLSGGTIRMDGGSPILAPPAGAPTAAAAARARAKADALAAARAEAEGTPSDPRISAPAPQRADAPPPAEDYGSSDLAPVAPMGASYSKADDPIELPVKKAPMGLFALAGAAVIALVIGGVVMFSGGEPKKEKTAQGDKAQTTSTAATPSTTATAAATPLPTASVTATASGSTSATASASASASATASASASASASAKPSSEPIAQADPKPSSKPKPTSDNPKPKPTGDKPKPSGTGIIRETPF